MGIKKRRRRRKKVPKHPKRIFEKRCHFFVCFQFGGAFQSGRSVPESIFCCHDASQSYTSCYTNMFLKEHFQLSVMEMLPQAHMWIFRVFHYLSNSSHFFSAIQSYLWFIDQYSVFPDHISKKAKKLVHLLENWKTKRCTKMYKLVLRCVPVVKGWVLKVPHKHRKGNRLNLPVS